ncbi:MAG: DnaJ C-terminal domain-containing protein [Candidatus Limnocylindria bacterium]
MDYKDYYATLGVPRTASSAEIKKAFRKQAREHHPDKKPGDAVAERRFKDINEAHAVLSDPEKRKLYDRLGSDWEAYARAGATAGAGARAGGAGAAGGPFAGFGGAQGGNVRYEFRSTGDAGGFSDFFNMFFGGDGDLGTMGEAGAASGPGRGRRATGGPTFEDVLAGMGLSGAGSGPTAGARSSPGHRPGGGRPGATRSAPRPSAEATAAISLDEAFHGTTRLVEVDGKRLEVTIPAGADTGTRIRLAGKAPGGGDLYVIVRLEPDPVFTRKGADLERELSLTLREALLGAEVPVRTPKGRVLLTIPPGTQTGRVFRLTGRGMPRMKGGGHGDVLVRVRVVLPTDLSPRAAKAAATFLDLVDQPDPRTRES